MRATKQHRGELLLATYFLLKFARLLRPFALGSLNRCDVG